MSKSTITLAAGLTTLLLAGALVWQFIKLEKLRSENALLQNRAAEFDTVLPELTRLRQSQVDPNELQRLRNNNTELLALRNQVTQLKRQVKAAEEAASRAQAQAQTAAAASPAPSEASAAPYETFTANLNSTVPWGNTLVAGGWQTAPGKRTYVALDAETVEESPGQIAVKCRIVEIPDGVLTMGLTGSLPSGHDAHHAAFMPRDQYDQTINQMPGANLVSAPAVSVLSGRQAQMMVTESHTLPSGEVYSTGPVIDIIPTITGGGNGVNFSISVQYNVAK